MPRVSIQFSDEAYQELENLAKTQGKSMAEVMRDALALERWAQQESKAGSRLLIERDGTAREVVRPR